MIDEIIHYPSAMVGLMIIVIMIGLSIHTVITRPYAEVQEAWLSGGIEGKPYVPKLAKPEWINIFRKHNLPVTIVLDSRSPGAVTKTYRTPASGSPEIELTFSFDYPYRDFPQDAILYFYPTYTDKKPFATITWITPDGRELLPKGLAVSTGETLQVGENLSVRRLVDSNPNWQEWFTVSGTYPTPAHYLLFADQNATEAQVLPGTYQMRVNVLMFEDGGDFDAELVILGEVYGVAGTDYLRRDLLLPLLWGMPIALAFGLVGASLTTILAMIVAALGVWYGGWVDTLIQRIIEANMILPILAVGILVYGYFGVSLWIILAIVVLLNVFSSPTKAFRAAFLQVKESPYIEAALAYGARDGRIIMRYMVPRIMVILIPQLTTLIPSYVFLEATLGMFNVKINFPTWGRVIFEGLKFGAAYGSRYWVLEPIGLIFLTSIAFSMLGFALERILNPRLKEI